jgi:adenylate cyclase
MSRHFPAGRRRASIRTVKRPERAVVLFAKVVGATGAISHCIRQLREATASAGGEVVKTMGDELMAVFLAADAAAAAATRMQLAVHGLAPIGGSRLSLRVGFQAGPVIRRDGDVFGDTVNLGARLAEQATRGQILTSRQTAELLTPALRNSTRRLYSVEMKGKRNTVELCEVLWEQSADVTDMAVHEAAPASHLRLRYRGKEIEAAEGGLTIGRVHECDLKVDDEHASRRHCTIEQRNGKFVVHDHSANGTYITIEGEGEIVLHREDFVLRGHGWFTFGQPRDQSAESVEFFCD